MRTRPPSVVVGILSKFPAVRTLHPMGCTRLVFQLMIASGPHIDIVPSSK
jgi:hypothetical protein